MDEHKAHPAANVDERSDLDEGADFASHLAARGKMQLWLTAFTTAAAVAIFAVVSLSLMGRG